MASQERLEYFISAAFKDEGVRQAMQAFGKLNAESAKVVREMERISQAAGKAGASIRDTRTGFAQVGMQINQFGTQVASGTSITTAFVQQIGDVGWAMSNMKGILGTVGSFLAGPWGVAVMGAAFVLSKLLDTTNEADAVTIQYDKTLASSKNALFQYQTQIASTRGELIDLYQAQLVGFEMQWRAAATDVATFGGQVQRTGKILESWANKPLWMVGKAYFENTQANEKYVDAVKREGEAYAQMMGAQTAYARLKQGFAKEDLRNAKAAERAQDRANREEEAAQRKIESQQSTYNAMVNRIEDIITVRTNETDAIGKAKKAYSDFNDLIIQMKGLEVGKDLVGLKWAQDNKKRIDEVRDVFKNAIYDAEEWKLMLPAPIPEATKKLDEYKEAVKDVATSTAGAFKNMLIAGGSFKDGMKSIINAVIDKLWEMFVVQQIVGFITNAVGGLFGLSPSGAKTDAKFGGNLMSSFDQQFGFKGNANGTPSWQGGLTWVGERGPELVNLPRGAGVIPAHRASQMGSGGINITVDARGSADPAAVRAQVQQGILEAAPAIVAAAQQRTVSGLRRPKLGGVMQ